MSLICKRTGVEKKFFDLCNQLVSEEGYILYDMEYLRGSFTLRLYIMNEETGTALIEDCVKIDRAMTPYVEEADWMPEELNLEVSSPGVYRHLKSKWHFDRVIGETICVNSMLRIKDDNIDNLPKSLKGQKKFNAILKEVSEEGIVLNFEKEKFDLFLKFEEIKKANLEINISK